MIPMYFYVAVCSSLSAILDFARTTGNQSLRLNWSANVDFFYLRCYFFNLHCDFFYLRCDFFCGEPSGPPYLTRSPDEFIVKETYLLFE